MELPRYPAMALLLACAVLVALPELASAKRFIVGGGNVGWSPNTNYTIWAQKQHFYIGDWLFFVYDRNQQNIIELNESSYLTCNTDHPLVNWTRGAGRDLVPLNKTGTRYFASGNGFCFSGMKMAVKTEKLPPAPKASPVKSHSSRTFSSAFGSHLALPIAFAVAAAWDGLLRAI